jgi:ferredoxin-NADP reductase
MAYVVSLLEIIFRTRNVNSYRVEKPNGFEFTPGQATDFTLLKKGFENEKRPFTFTGLPADNYLEFTIKSYDDHEGVTHQLRNAKKGDRFEIGDPWGAISYKGEGVFIAGGAGVTPFISIFRYLNQHHEIGKNRLFFSNKSDEDIILKDEFSEMLGKNFINIITQQPNSMYQYGRINKDFLKKNISNFDKPFYVCGPEFFNQSVLQALGELGAQAESLVFEK